MFTKARMLRMSRLMGLLMVSAILFSAMGTGAAPKQQALAPIDFFGYNMADDYQITPWMSRELPEIGYRKGFVEYMYHLQDNTNRVHVIPNGFDVLGLPEILTVIASPDTWARIDKFKEINKKLADPRLIASDAEAMALAKAGKPVYWINGAIHSSERTSLETEIQLAYELATGKDDFAKEVLDNVIVIIEGTNNPHGTEWVTDWYYRYLNTATPNVNPPCYHEYVCHDTNRDFIGLSMVELRNSALARFEWNPVTYADMHHSRDLHYLGFPSDPLNIAYGSISQAEKIGQDGFIMTEMAAHGFKGVFTYDYANMWNPTYNHMYTVVHNGFGGWWEQQSARIGPKPSYTMITSGLNNCDRKWYNPEPYCASTAAPLVWKFKDAFTMQLESHKYGILYVARNPEEMLYNFYVKGKRQAVDATATAPYAFVIPANGGDNHDVIDLINNLDYLQHVEVFQATAPFSLDGRNFNAGDYVVDLNQPYGMWAKSMLSRQDYPYHELVNQYLCRSGTCNDYDDMAWTLGMFGDVEVVGLNSKLPAGMAMTPVDGELPYAGVLTGGLSTDYVVEHASNNGLSVALPVLWRNPNMSVAQVDTAFTAGGMTFPAGTFLVRTTGSPVDHDWLKTVVEQNGLTAYSIGSGEVPVGAVALTQPKVGILKYYQDTTYEGWTRKRFDDDKFPYTSLKPEDIRDNKFGDYDVIIIASISMNGLVNDRNNYPPEFSAGIGAAGVANLKAWTEAGGKLILTGQATTLPIDYNYGLVGVTRANVPSHVAKGVIVNYVVDPTTKDGYGFDTTEFGAYSAGSGTPLFNVDPASSAKVVASFPMVGPVLASGYFSDETGVLGKAAIVEAPLGAGTIFMISPNVTYRAIARGTYMFLWNAVIAGGR